MKRAPFFNLAHSAISQPAKIWPDKCALELIAPLNEKAPPKSWTFKSLERDMLNTAEGFRQQGLNQGDVILLRLENGPNFIFAFFAAIAAGAIPVPLSPKITEGELAFFLSDTGAEWIIKSKTLPVSDALSKNCTIIKEETLEQWRAAHDDNFIGTYAKTTAETPAFLIYTSGTSSNPKGVLHAQRVILGRAPMKNGWHDIKETDRVLHAGDFNWTYTLGIGLMDPWVNGATACLYAGMKTPETWPLLIDQAMPTIFAAVPGVYRQILKHSHFEKQQLSSLRHGLCAGEALPAPLKIKWQQETGIPLYEAMGQSEISTYVSTAPGITVPEGAKGRIQKGRKLAILPINPATEREAESPLPANEIGLIALHRDDPGLMLSYWPPSDLKLSGPFMRGP